MPAVCDSRQVRRCLWASVSHCEIRTLPRIPEPLLPIVIPGVRVGCSATPARAPDKFGATGTQVVIIPLTSAWLPPSWGL